MSAKRRLTILGSTGSVGVSTLEVVALHPHKFEIVALTARNQIPLLFEQCLKHRPRFAVVLDPAMAGDLHRRFHESGLRCEVLCGLEALETVATLPEVDSVMAAIVGFAGLRSTLAAARAGKRVMLANKESLVTAGPLLIDAARASGAQLLPIDSEHNAIFQALPACYSGEPDAAGVRRILLTASGGPFRVLPLCELEHVTPEQACAHPNWVMGRKISVDSATMMNKGLEVIEAHWLFNIAPQRIEVVIHPESIVHSLVEYIDGSVIAQLGNPDMRTPIAHALDFPSRMAAGVPFLDLARIGALRFEAPDLQRFPCLRLAYQALAAGGSAPTAMNAANEVAVARFLAGTISFPRIAAVIEDVLSETDFQPARELEEIMAADAKAREAAERMLGRSRAPAGSRAAHHATGS
jgi:1-deoxy-D-xylulose-5-phosphate reductoisomerase